MKTNSPVALQQAMLGPQHVQAVDVNSLQSWLKARVPGARHADPVAFVEADLPADKDTPLVTCLSCLPRNYEVEVSKLRCGGIEA